jgi:hypothetical protein
MLRAKLHVRHLCAPQQIQCSLFLSTMDSGCSHAGQPFYNAYVAYTLLGERGSAAHGLNSHQLKAILQDGQLLAHRRAHMTNVWPAQSKVLHERVHDSRGAFPGGNKLQFVGFVELLIELAASQDVDVHTNLHKVQSSGHQLLS